FETKPQPDADGEAPERRYPFPIDAVASAKTSKSNYQASFHRAGADRAWRQHYRPKTARELGERGDTLDTTGPTLASPEPTTAPEDDAAPTSTRGRQAPSNQKGATPIRAMSVRPGAIDALSELDGYGVHQSVWTHNSEHHMHRVLELFEALGFAEHRFD